MNVLISYDLHQHRDYSALHDLLNQWGAVRLQQSLWIADLVPGRTGAIRDELMHCVDGDDEILVIELTYDFEWAAWARLGLGEKLSLFTTAVQTEGLIG